MKNARYYLVLDVGTSGIKALLFNKNLEAIGRSHTPIKRFFPKPGFVEQNPQELLDESIKVLRNVMKETKIKPKDIQAIGITNQRETTILWNKKTGEPVYKAIVWEDNRTEKDCKKLQNFADRVRQKTGLFILPYFSATKIWWILQHVPKAKALLKKKQLLFGTVDSWILWNLSKEKIHATDMTNASRTLLFDIKKCTWSSELIKAFSVEGVVFPKVYVSQHTFGTFKKEILGKEIPILAICGDQQSSLYGVGVENGSTKITYGTGTFIMQSIGKTFAICNDFFTTLIPYKKSFAYALEAKIDNSGARVSLYLKDKNKLHEVMDVIVKDAANAIKKFPTIPTYIIADGGITREKYILEKQSQLLTIPVLQNKIFDGTAYGTAKLLKDF